ncbi:ABC transporter ATP-binding protein [Acinetobacter modestus]|uniref:ABC transporter ATP-binding protein n=1 Tax=Acinetobacter modestus TaxID=1776740 RepID=UPI00320B5241
MHQNIDIEIRNTEQELKHLGSCTSKGLTNKKIAQLDERFFLAIEKLKRLKILCNTPHLRI